MKQATRRRTKASRSRRDKQDEPGTITVTEERDSPPRPPERWMTIVAQDPSVMKDGHILMARVAVPAEDLRDGPIGYRVQVVDFDSTTRQFLGAHSLPETYEDEPKAWRDGLPSLLKHPRFHAQNAYAIVMKTLARFEFALGRRIGWSFDTHQLKVAPHGMADANAFYSPEIEGLVLGYFDAPTIDDGDRTSRRRGKTGRRRARRPAMTRVFTCLSHDVIVHETTHALLDALRDRYMDPSTPDQGAFHEGFADVVALLSVFALPEVVEHLLSLGTHSGGEVPTVTRENVMPGTLCESALFGLADEMGQALEGVRGQSLRKSAEIVPSPALKDTPEFLEPHRRGELFVAAVLRGFIDAWSDRVLSSAPPDQREFPVRRVAEEGANVADALVTMWIRAIDYMPPVHLTFGDALSAALTADYEVRPDDSRYELRRHMMDSFKAFGFKPASNRTTPACIWLPPPPGLKYDRVRFDSMRSDEDEVFRFIWDNRQKLKLADGAFTQVLSVKPSVRIGIDGFVVRETVATYYQVARLTPDEMKAAGVKAPLEFVRALKRAAKPAADERVDPPAHAHGATAEAVSNGDNGSEAIGEDDARPDTTPLYGGGVLIFDEYGRVKYWVYNHIFGKQQTERLRYMWEQGILQPTRKGTRLRRTPLSALHRLRALQALTANVEGW